MLLCELWRNGSILWGIEGCFLHSDLLERFGSVDFVYHFEQAWHEIPHLPTESEYVFILFQYCTIINQDQIIYLRNKKKIELIELKACLDHPI